MSLQFIAGPGGIENSRFIYRRLIDRSLKESDRSFYVLVPEQYSMQAQGELVNLHPGKCITNIDVLSFTRLSKKVFDITGFNSGPVLDDTGKLLVLRKIAHDLSDDLPLLGPVLEKQGAASLIKSLITELMQYRVTPEDMEKLCRSDKLTGSAAFKLMDTAKLYDTFLKTISGKYITAEEMPGILAGRLDMTDFLKDTDVYLDGFTGFVPIQMEVIGKLFEHCRNVTVVLTMDPDGEAADILRGKRHAVSKGDLFRMSGETALAVMEKALEKGVDILPPVFVGEDKRRKEDLSFLSGSIYGNGYVKYSGKADNVHICGAEEPKDEVLDIAETIRGLIRCGKYRYRDIAVITGDPDTYDDLFEDVFAECDIPLFTDRKKPVISNPAVEFIRSAIGLMTDGFSYRSVFRYLRSGMTEFSAGETDLLETYVLAAGLKGYAKYDEEWTRTFPTISEETLAGINGIRERFAGSLREYVNAMRVRSSRTEDKTKALYSLIEKNALQEKCLNMAGKFEEQGDYLLYREYSQIYRIVIDDLDKLTEILGEERVSLKTYEQLTEAMFAERKLGLIPPGADRVTVGDMERSRLSKVKVLFLAGANEGLMPSPVSRSSLLSPAEREQLARNDIKLAPDEREELLRQRFYMYLLLSRPSDGLYISFAGRGAGDRALMPSSFIARIKTMFPDGIAEGLSAEEKAFRRLETERGRESMLCSGMRKLSESAPDDVFLELCSWFAKTEDRASVYENVRAAYTSRAPKPEVDPGACMEIYGRDFMFSATRIDRFAGCAFAHFLQYGLGLRERDILEWNAPAKGSLVHSALQFFVQLAGAKNDWKGMTEEDIKLLSGQAFEMALAENAQRIPSDARSAFAIGRIRELAELASRSVTEQIRRGSFTPFATEMPYSISGVRGVIDRLDICTIDGKTYFRVIDYKTGPAALSLTKLYYGAGIQLPLYMKAAIDSRDKIHVAAEAAGVYYSTVAEPLERASYAGEELSTDSLIRSLMLRGLTRNETEILNASDESLARGENSDILKINLKTDGTPNAYSEVISTADLDTVYRYTGFIIGEMRQKIMSGEAGIHPLKYGSSSACDFCAFKGVCRFDRRVPGYAEKICDEMKRGDALEAMNERMNNGNETV